MELSPILAAVVGALGVFLTQALALLIARRRRRVADDATIVRAEIVDDAEIRKELWRQIRELRERQDELERRLDESRNEYYDLQRMHIALEAEHKILEVEHAALQQKHELLQRQLTALTVERAELGGG